jgi:hypothetical protein
LVCVLVAAGAAHAERSVSGVVSPASQSPTGDRPAIDPAEGPDGTIPDEFGSEGTFIFRIAPVVKSPFAR